MSDEPRDSFVARWSRRKVAARRGDTLSEPAPPAQPAPAPAQPAAVATPEPAVELPSLETLKGLESDYKAFLQPEVDPATRSAALRKLFGDPHFNTMDRLDVYIDDYSVADPIPATMLKTLSAARSLGLFDDESEKKQAEDASAPVAAPAPDAPAEPTSLPAESAAPSAAEAVGPDPVDVRREPDAA